MKTAIDKSIIIQEALKELPSPARRLFHEARRHAGRSVSAEWMHGNG